MERIDATRNRGMFEVVAGTEIAAGDDAPLVTVNVYAPPAY